MRSCTHALVTAAEKANRFPAVYVQVNIGEEEQKGGCAIAEIGDDGREYRLTPAAAAAWRTMKQAAASDSVVLKLVSAFRSVDRQVEIVREKLAEGASIDEILSASAPPGFSEHHTGRAVDITSDGAAPLEIEFEQTPAFRWLSKNAGQFGFALSYPVHNPYGYDYEPWHWCFRPT